LKIAYIQLSERTSCDQVPGLMVVTREPLGLPTPNLPQTGDGIMAKSIKAVNVENTTDK